MTRAAQTIARRQALSTALSSAGHAMKPTHDRRTCGRASRLARPGDWRLPGSAVHAPYCFESLLALLGLALFLLDITTPVTTAPTAAPTNAAPILLS
ncbi:MAG: hypothetical protein AW07_03909 [Candidatus Accumulibacter sp. SK-11]|nr:MAG: hypothetical protein AW07_03909 [Candidatus Accumulibacter sp. SK-11]